MNKLFLFFVDFCPYLWGCMAVLNICKEKKLDPVLATYFPPPVLYPFFYGMEIFIILAE